MTKITTLTIALLTLFSLSALAQFESYSAVELQKSMSSGKATSVQITSYYLGQIALQNSQLAAVTTINPLALDEARQMDLLRDQGKILSPLHGVPVLIKDNIDVKGGMPNTAGSLLLKSNRPEKDAFLVAKLREAGLIILGKASLSEWANFRSTHSVSGWSAMAGQVRNPYDLSRSPCGSSSGSAVAVAAGMAPLAVGTETDGSITCPAAINGVVGIKPTLGHISRSGIIPISHHQDTAGPIATTVQDAVLLLDAMAGLDNNDPDSFASHSLADTIKLKPLRGLRIGVVSTLTGYSPPTDRVFANAVKLLQGQGAEIVERLSFDSLPEIEAIEFEHLMWAFKSEMAEYLENSQAPSKSLKALIAANKKQPEELAIFGQEIFEKSEMSKGTEEPEYLANAKRLKLLARQDGIDKLLRANNLDVLIAPTTGPAWKIDDINGDHYMGSASTPAAVAGYPHITVPMGFVKHLPVGISFFAGFQQDDKVISAASAFESASNARRAPAQVK